MNHNDLVKQLPSHLFWDSDISKLDDVKHFKKIIIRTFERGDIADMATVIACYGDSICSEVLKEAEYLEESARLLGSLFLSLNEEDFVSYSRKQHHSI